MRILAFESSAKAASVALLTEGELTAEFFLNNGLTHSRTLMKLAEDLLASCALSPDAPDLLAWANGPGSFTGVRIGAAAAKGFCWGLELPCLPVSTLEAMAWNGAGLTGILCCCMDARRSQVYNALFRAEDGRPERLTEDRAISLEALALELAAYREPVYLLGDGAALAWKSLSPETQTAQCPPCRLILAPEHQRQQRASGVALAAWAAIRAGAQPGSAAQTAPNYLRLSQAEREKLEREKTNKGDD